MVVASFGAVAVAVALVVLSGEQSPVGIIVDGVVDNVVVSVVVMVVVAMASSALSWHHCKSRVYKANRMDGGGGNVGSVVVVSMAVGL